MGLGYDALWLPSVKMQIVAQTDPCYLTLFSISADAWYFVRERPTTFPAYYLTYHQLC